MPQSDKFTGAPLPLPAESSNASAYLKAIFDVVGPRTVLIASSQADRDAKYSDAPNGAIATCGVAGAEAVWLKIATGWRTLWYDTGWVTTGFTYPTAGWQLQTGYARVRDLNGLVDLRVRVIREGAGQTSAANGNLSDENVIILPAGFAPATHRVMCPASLNGIMAVVAVNPGAGAVTLWATVPSFGVIDGVFCEFSASYLKG